MQATRPDVHHANLITRHVERFTRHYKENMSLEEFIKASTYEDALTEKIEAVSHKLNGLDLGLLKAYRRFGS